MDEPRAQNINYNENSQSQYNAALESLALMPNNFQGNFIQYQRDSATH